jgi:hypothetical protein
MKSTSKYISSRPDRYGANGIPWIVASTLFPELYHNCNENCHRYKDTIVHNFLIKYSKNIDCTPDEDLMAIDGGGWPIKKLLNDMSFPDYFHGTTHFKELKKMYENKFGNNYLKNCTIIHARLDDAGPAHNFQKFGIYQAFVGTENMVKIIKWAQGKFKLPVYIAGAQNAPDIELCRHILQQCDVENVDDFILRGNTIDHDIYIMSRADNLIVGRSTFAMMAGLINENTVYAEDWVHLRDLVGNNNSRKFQTLP